MESEKQIKLEKEIHQNVNTFLSDFNKNLPPTMELEYEGFYRRGFFLTKKRYAVIENGKIIAKGLELVRRDWAPIAKETQENILTAILKEGDIDKALKQGIVHYNGQKPWKGYCINFDLWWEYYRKSPFFNEKFYFDFFYHRLNIFDQLSLWKRIKILVRYFVYGKRII